jgi:hypothetical protein
MPAVASKEGYVIPSQLLALVRAANPDNTNNGVPVLNQSETGKILQNVSAEMHGARRNEHKYEVRRLGKVDTAAVDFVKLDSHAAYESHVHQCSDSKIYITQGFGFLILGKKERPQDEVWHPYKPGDTFYVPRGTFHCFFTIWVTHFVSVNDPEILDPQTGHVDIQFETAD